MVLVPDVMLPTALVFGILIVSLLLGSLRRRTPALPNRKPPDRFDARTLAKLPPW